MRKLLTDVFKKQGKWLRIYIGKETIQDPYEKNVSVVNINPIPVRAIIEDLTATQAQWKMPGIKVSKVKDVLIEAKHKTLLESSSKLQFDGDYYEGWKENGRMQFRDQPGVGEDGYIRFYMYTKAV